MSAAESVSEAVQRLSRRDSSLSVIYLYRNQRTDGELAELVDCLLAQPDRITSLYLGGNRLTDETGVKLARYIAASSTIQTLDLWWNQFGSATYLALAAALRVNTSLRDLSLGQNTRVEQTRIEAAFVDALRLNPNRPAESWWLLRSSEHNEFARLREAASQLGHPSLQLQLALLC